MTTPKPVLLGENVTKVGVYLFRCPVCRNEVRFNDMYEPMCTGPNWTDDHDMTIMDFVGVEDKKVSIDLGLHTNP